MNGTYSRENSRYENQFTDSSRSPARKNSSRSPQRENRNANRADKANPEPNNCIGIFGLSSRTKQEDLSELFEKYGKIDKIQLVTDKYTGESRGFCFINYDSISSASKAIEKANGIDIDGKTVRIDYSLTKKAHDPTPGHYMGKESARQNQRYDDRGRNFGDNKYQRRSISRSPIRRSRVPYNEDRGAYMSRRSPRGDMRFPERGMRSPPRGMRSPPRGMRSPPRGMRSPPRGIRSPPRGMRSPPRGVRVPARDGRSPQDFIYRNNDRFPRREQF